MEMDACVQACLGALPLLYPAAPPSVFAFGKYTSPAVCVLFPSLGDGISPTAGSFNENIFCRPKLRQMLVPPAKNCSTEMSIVPGLTNTNLSG